MGRSDSVRRRSGSKRVKKRKRQSNDGETLVLGWREWVALPGLGVPRLKAKVDTGARTSALHAFRIHTFEREGVETVEFLVHPEQRRRQPEILCRAPIYDRRSVASSNGQSEDRIVILTTIEMAGRAWPIEVTLANRDQMGFRMLLGREALRGRAVVDPGRSYCAGKSQVAIEKRTSIVDEN